MTTGLCRCDRGPHPENHSPDLCPRWCAFAHQHPTQVPYAARATSIFKDRRPPPAPDQLKDPRRLTDGTALAYCTCPSTGPEWQPVNPACPVHGNQTIAQEDQ